MKNYSAKKKALLLVNSIHGSGIDSDYLIRENRNNILIRNNFHCMNEIGSYDGWCPFSVILDKKTTEIKKIVFHVDSYMRRKYVWILKDYLEDLFFSKERELSVKEYIERPYYLRTVEFLS